MFYSSGTFSRKLCRSVFSLLCMLSGVCAAQQNNQFLNVPQVEGTGGQVASFLTGTFQQPPNLTDILYINAPVVSGTTSSITVGELLNGQGFTNLGENQIAFTNVSSVVAAVADFDGDGNTDYAFALTPTVPGGTNLCVYYGTGATVKSGGSSYNGGNTPNAYPPTGGKSGCLTFPSPGAVVPPKYTFISAPSLKTINGPQLIIEDSANNIVTILANGGTLGNNGALTSFSSWTYINLSAADGAGPIYAADLNGDGNTDLIINCQTSQSALVYFGDGSNNFSKNPVRYTFGGHIHSMLLQDMDGDGHPDMVVEADNGVIEIFHGNPDGTFASTSEGGTVASVGQEGYIGDGGHLAAINPFTRDILVTTPIGLSVLQGSGSLSYSLKNIYNIGPGRTSFAMADFFGTNRLDFAVDSPEGVAIVRADTNGDGGFQTSNAYPALQPALGTTVGKFRNSANNPKGNLDVVAATGAIQAQLLTGNGDGTFNTLPSVVDSSPNTQPFNPPPPGVWSNVLSGDFDGDGNLDVLYSLTGLPQPPPSNALALYIQYGIGDGTFDQSGNSFGVGGFSISSDGVYLESAVGDVNGDGVSDEAISDAIFDEVALGIKGIRTGFTGTFTQADSSNTNFSQVAAGFFKTGRTNQQDVVFQQGSSFIPYVNKQDGTGIHFTAMPALTGATVCQYRPAHRRRRRWQWRPRRRLLQHRTQRSWCRPSLTEPALHLVGQWRRNLRIAAARPQTQPQLLPRRRSRHERRWPARYRPQRRLARQHPLQPGQPQLRKRAGQRRTLRRSALPRRAGHQLPLHRRREWRRSARPHRRQRRRHHLECNRHRRQDRVVHQSHAKPRRQHRRHHGAAQQRQHQACNRIADRNTRAQQLRCDLHTHRNPHPDARSRRPHRHCAILHRRRSGWRGGCRRAGLHQLHRNLRRPGR